MVEFRSEPAWIPSRFFVWLWGLVLVVHLGALASGEPPLSPTLIGSVIVGFTAGVLALLTDQFTAFGHRSRERWTNRSVGQRLAIVVGVGGVLAVVVIPFVSVVPDLLFDGIQAGVLMAFAGTFWWVRYRFDESDEARTI